MPSSPDCRRRAPPRRRPCTTCQPSSCRCTRTACDSCPCRAPRSPGEHPVHSAALGQGSPGAVHSAAALRCQPASAASLPACQRCQPASAASLPPVCPPHCLTTPAPLHLTPRRALVDNLYEAAAEFFCERRGFSREAALSVTGPVAALLAGARSHLQQPKQLLLGRLAGMVASGGGSGSSRSLQHPAAWQFFVRLLCCLRALQGAGWEPLVKASCPLVAPPAAASSIALHPACLLHGWPDTST